MKNLHIDFETACTLDLTKVGLHRYIEDPSFRPLCVAWKVDAGTPVAVRLDKDDPLPPELETWLASPDVQAHAWNSAFEDRILRDHYGIILGRPLSCTMQRALAYGLPGSLEKAGPALSTQWRKDVAGHRLMRKMSRQPGAAWTGAEWDGLLEYCKRDVLSEAEIAGLIPELSVTERELSELDRCMNNQGIWVDLDTVRLLARVAHEAGKAEAARAAELSDGAVTSPGTQTDRLKRWLQGEGLSIGDVGRPTIEEAAACAQASAKAKEMLGIRLRTARGSVAKLAAMVEMASAGSQGGPADRLRGQFQFLGAARTGRWAGRGIQPQNLPRIPKGFSPLSFIGMAEANGHSLSGVSQLDAIAPAPILDCVAWSIRACLGTEDGLMWSFDFSQIEARVLAWLSGHSALLDVFRSGEDVYVWAAAQFGSQNRQLGKVLILALGFGMGAPKLKTTALRDYAVAMTAEEAKRFHAGWRMRNRRIVKFWGTIETAARSAILRRGCVFGVEPSAITLSATARTLQMRLPSGRALYYHQPHVGADGAITYWGEEKGQWVERRTWGGTLAENATQAVARDIMAEAMMRVANQLGSAPLMTVHDELVYAAPAETSLLKNLMMEAPDWAGGLPIDGEAKVMTRYGVAAK